MILATFFYYYCNEMNVHHHFLLVILDGQIIHLILYYNLNLSLFFTNYSHQPQNFSLSWLICGYFI